MDSIVALDIETTGLDSTRDAIIEIGAVRFKQHRVEAEWSTLINPGRPIPPMITQLTGITDQMVLQAPPIHKVLADLEAFVSDSPVLGHNVSFDLGFLRHQHILGRNEAIDTYELASFLIPCAQRYNLSSLAQSLGVLLPATHRALDDAQATRGVYLRLLEEAMKLPLPLVAEFIRLSEDLDWSAHNTLRQILRARREEVTSRDAIRHAYAGPIYTEPPQSATAPLQPLEESLPLNEDDVAAVLEHGGVFAHLYPQFEYRPQQVQMLREVTRALSQGYHLLVEAGTGTGKSLAYLIPAALWAYQNNTRVVISTNTINLQDQLINKDIPDLRRALDVDIQAIVLKGKSNYLCPRRLESLRRRGPTSVEEIRVLAKVMVWLQTTTTGDRSELNLNNPVERDVWTHICADDEGCTAENCIKRTGGICPLHRKRQAAQSAHLLIVNHALLLADVATGNRILPDYTHVIIDEAHHLEDATTDALSYRLTEPDVDRMLKELGGPNTGLLGWLLTATHDVVSPGDYASLSYLVDQATDLAFRFENLLKGFFISLNDFLTEQRDGQPMGQYSHQERILPATRTQPAWMDVEATWDDAEHVLQPLLETVQKLISALSDLLEALSEQDSDLFNSISNLYRRFDELHKNLNALVFEPASDRIYWTEINSNNMRLSLHAAPLHIGPLMQQYLWNEKTSVILTSATLTAAGQFDYLRGRLAAEVAEEVALDSPFDYENSVLLYLAKDVPEPGDRRGHQRAIETTLIQLCRQTGGRTLVLFTSYDQLRRTSQAIAPVLARDNILIFEQGQGPSANSLLESFRSAERAVLLGTKAFWEGVDVPGEALSVLVIAKLPFDVPSDPIIAARSETFDDPFSQYSLPGAILRFRQGFGRLIRTHSDRGLVIVLDSRILAKNYGKLFLESLPTCTTRVGFLADIPRAAKQWLNL